MTRIIEWANVVRGTSALVCLCVFECMGVCMCYQVYIVFSSFIILFSFYYFCLVLPFLKLYLFVYFYFSAVRRHCWIAGTISSCTMFLLPWIPLLLQWLVTINFNTMFGVVVVYWLVKKCNFVGSFKCNVKFKII